METLGERIRDRIILNTIRLVSVGNGTAKKLAEPYQEMVLRWVVQLQALNIDIRGIRNNVVGLSTTILVSGIKPFYDAVSLIREDMIATGRVQHGITVRMLRQELARSVKEEVSVDDLATGEAVKELAEDVADIVDSLPVSGTVLAEFSDRQLFLLTQGMRRLLREAVTESWRLSRITEAMSVLANSSRTQAEKYARTAILQISNEVNDRLYRANSDIVREKEYLATLDKRTCLICAADDRRRFPVGGGPSLPRHLNCRCTYAPVTKTWRQMGIAADEIGPGTRASMSGYVPGETSYAAWLARQPKPVQKEILGPARFDLYQQGMEIDKFTNLGQVLTLDQLEKKR